jgi:hypothetical protein
MWIVDEVDVETRPAPRAGTVVREVGEEILLIDTARARGVVIDAAARLLWECFDGSSLSEIAFDISDIYGVPMKEVEESLVVTTQTFGSSGLLANVHPAALPVLPPDVGHRSAGESDPPAPSVTGVNGWDDEPLDEQEWKTILPPSDRDRRHIIPPPDG